MAADGRLSRATFLLLLAVVVLMIVVVVKVVMVVVKIAAVVVGTNTESQHSTSPSRNLSSQGCGSSLCC